LKHTDPNLKKRVLQTYKLYRQTACIIKTGWIWSLFTWRYSQTKI